MVLDLLEQSIKPLDLVPGQDLWRLLEFTISSGLLCR